MQPYRTREQLARIAALPRNARWAPVSPAPSWRKSATAFVALVVLFVATEFAVAALGGAR